MMLIQDNCFIFLYCRVSLNLESCVVLYLKNIAHRLYMYVRSYIHAACYRAMFNHAIFCAILQVGGNCAKRFINFFAISVRSVKIRSLSDEKNRVFNFLTQRVTYKIPLNAIYRENQNTHFKTIISSW